MEDAEMGVKSNFSQAVSELIGISKTVEPEPEKELANEIPEMIEGAAETAAEEELIEEETEAMTDLDKENLQTEQKDGGVFKAGQNPKERIMAMLAQQQTSQPQDAPQQIQVESTQTAETLQQSQPLSQPQQSQPFQSQTSVRGNSDAIKEPPGVTTIARGTVLIGEINAEGDVELLGSVKGKVASHGDIRANGKVIGDLIGKDIELIACAVQGNIIASGSVTVDENSVVIGDVKGENFCLDGRIKGNVNVGNEAKFQPKAILAGNVTTTSIAMSQGAKIQGEVNIPLNEKETDISFDVDIVV
ncbi:polymer-forming cytoskeletal protein [Anoxybacterium hadale]|uniref:Polymer-forming cytoskeletal protein n=1 Tax=Anoxybacterium hadale TaxID=3408580 RepID=A0ACD1AG03_9FIRM|nr:polymer-forming cytoskeletal protein [Clostridiales bacterium]